MNNIDFNLDFYYNEESPSCLSYLRTINRHTEGFNVGTKEYRKNGTPLTWRVFYNKNRYKAHRIVWVLHHGSIDPDLYIDHIDGNPFNNKISNLRLVSPTENSRNAKMHVRNKTGVTGVIGIKDLSISDELIYYRGCYVDDNHRIVSKNFHIKNLGEVEAFNEAVKFREQGINKSSHYTKRHGEPIQ